MASFNRVLLMGNLTKDPEIRALPSGVNVADLRLAVNDDYTDKQGQKVERACFVDVVAWDKQADACARSLTKGSPILVEGKLQMDEWTTKEGEKRSKLRIRAERVQFLGPRRSGPAEGADREGGQEQSGAPAGKSDNGADGAPC